MGIAEEIAQAEMMARQQQQKPPEWDIIRQIAEAMSAQRMPDRAAEVYGLQPRPVEPLIPVVQPGQTYEKSLMPETWANLASSGANAILDMLTGMAHEATLVPSLQRLGGAIESKDPLAPAWALADLALNLPTGADDLLMALAKGGAKAAGGGIDDVLRNVAPMMGMAAVGKGKKVAQEIAERELKGEPDWSLWRSKERKEFYNPDAIQSSPEGYELWDFDHDKWRHFKNKAEQEKFESEWMLPPNMTMYPGAEEKTWFRFGKPPQSNRSINFAENRGENGVSVYATPEGGSPFFAERPVYSGPGRQVGWGSDGEPLVIPTGEWKKYEPAANPLRPGDITTPEFREWSGGAPVIQDATKHEFKTGEPVVVKGYHGAKTRYEYIAPTKEEWELERIWKEKADPVLDEYNTKSIPIFNDPNYSRSLELRSQIADLVKIRESKLKAIGDRPKVGHSVPVPMELEGGAFDPTRSSDIGTHFSASPAVADKFTTGGGAVYPVYLKFKNIIEVPDIFGRPGKAEDAVIALDMAGTLRPSSYPSLLSKAQRLDSLAEKLSDPRDLGTHPKNVDFWKNVRKSIKKEIDGFRYKNEVEGGGWSFVILDSSQAKSIWNKGSWSKTDPRILYGAGAGMAAAIAQQQMQGEQ